MLFVEHFSALHYTAPGTDLTLGLPKNHVWESAGAGEWFRKLRDIGIAAVIVSDPALIMIAATEAPGLEIHLSTQASATNYETLEFWKELGLTHVV